MTLDPRVLPLINTGIALLNTLLLVGLVLRGQPVSTGPTAAPVSMGGGLVASESPPPDDPHQPGGRAAEVVVDAPPAPTSAPTFRGVIDSVLTPLKTASADLGLPVTLPTDAGVDACVKTEDLATPACVELLAVLKAGYEKARMPFPSLNGPKESAERMPENGQGQGQDGAMIKVYLETLRARVAEAARSAGDNPDSFLPSSAAITGAAGSGSLSSPEATLVVDQLREAHRKYNLPFSEPATPGAPGGGPPGGSPGGSPGGAPGGPSGSPSGLQPAHVDAQAPENSRLKGYFEFMSHHVKQAAVQSGMDPTVLLPTDAEFAAATAGSPDSPAVEKVAAKLKESCGTLNIDFYPLPQ